MNQKSISAFDIRFKIKLCYVNQYKVCLLKDILTCLYFISYYDVLIASALGLWHQFFASFIFIEYVCLHDNSKKKTWSPTGGSGDKNEKCKTSSIPMKLGHYIGNSQILHAKRQGKKSCYIFQNWCKIR